MPRPRISFSPARRYLVQSVAIAGAGAAIASILPLGGCAAAPATGGPARKHLRLIGWATLAHRLTFKGTAVGGLSGLDYDHGSNLWYALSDDRSDINPARFYTLRLAVAADRLGPPELVDAVTLTQADGQPFPSRRSATPGSVIADIPDPEAIRYRASTRTLVWSSEGDVRRGLVPSVRESSLEGRQLRAFSMPPMFAIDPSGRSGPRDNLAFEGLSLTTDGTGAWVAMENALVQDGPEPTVQAPGGPCRFTLFDLATGQALRQRAYIPDPIPRASLVPGAQADNGVSEILMQDARYMLVLERAYMPGHGNSLRLYRVDTLDGSDTLQQTTLRAGSYAPMAKTLIADFADFVGKATDGQSALPRLDNTEGMAWGPRLPSSSGKPGARTLVFVSDDNFNPLQVTQFIAFEFLDPDS